MVRDDADWNRVFAESSDATHIHPPAWAVDYAFPGICGDARRESFTIKLRDCWCCVPVRGRR